MNCPECGKEMDLLIEESFGKTWYCHLCDKTIEEKF